MNIDPLPTILTFAQHCGNLETSAEEVARRRGWIDQKGAPTPDGMALVRELTTQKGVRSVFRGIV